MFMFWPNIHDWSAFLIRLIGQSSSGGSEWSECYHAARRIREGNLEDWYREWTGLGDAVKRSAAEAEQAGHPVTSRRNYLRAYNYYRAAEFFMLPGHPRKLAVYQDALACFQNAGRFFRPPLERVQVPFEGSHLLGYFYGVSGAGGSRPPVLLCFGGLDSTAEELYFLMAVGALERGIAVLALDGPGQGASFRQNGLLARHDFEGAVSAGVDYLQARKDVDGSRIALAAISLGGYYAARGAAFEPRLKACIVWGADYDYYEVWQKRADDHPMAAHLTWILGARDIAEAREKLRDFHLRGIASKIRCPLLITHSEVDTFVPVEHAYRLYEEATCDKEMMIFKAGEAGELHCQSDHLPLAHARVFDWLTDKLGTAG